MLDLDGRPREGLDALHAAFPDLAAAPVRVLGTALELQLAAGDRAGADAAIAAARQAEPDDRQVERLATARRRRQARAQPRSASPADGMGDALLSISEAFFEQERNAEAMVLARAATFVAPDGRRDLADRGAHLPGAAESDRGPGGARPHRRRQPDRLVGRPRPGSGAPGSG